MTIKAVPVTAENFKPFGRMYEVDREHMRTGCGGWKAWTAPGDIMDDKVNIGITWAKNMPFKVDSMECHNPTQEVMVCGNKPMVLAVANSTPWPQASGADPASIRAFIIQPGQVVVINRSIWHDACRSAVDDGEECYYYFLARSGLEEVAFYPVMGEAVEVVL